MANVRVRAQGFRGGKADSTFSKIKMKRGTRIEEVERMELMELENTADLTEIDYDSPESKVFET